MGFFDRFRRKDKVSTETPVAKPKTNSLRDDSVTMSAEFARALLKQSVRDPRRSSSRKSTRAYKTYTKENILKWLQTPSEATSMRMLCRASNYLYLYSMHYNRLLNYYAGLYTGAYVISPVGFSDLDVKENFVKQYRKVAKFLEMIDVPQIMHDITLVALRDGAYYGVYLNDNNSAFLLPLDPEDCQITSICDGTFLFQVNMANFTNKLQFYPAEFVTMYNNYIATGEPWQDVPSDISVCIKGDPTLVDYTIPPFSAVMPKCYRIANTEDLQDTADDLKNYMMLSGKVPLDDKGNPLMSDAEVKKWYAHVANNLDDNVGLVMTPFSFDSFKFDGSDGTTYVDTLQRTISNFWSTAGTSGLLHGEANDTSGVTKLAIKNDETYVLPIVQQIERVINRYLKTSFSSTTKFKITILPVTVFNKEDFLQYYKEAAAFGLGKSHYAAALGIPQYDLNGLNYIEKQILPFDELEPLQSSYTSSMDGGDVGRPALDETDLGEEGEATRDNDTNANR